MTTKERQQLLNKLLVVRAALKGMVKFPDPTAEAERIRLAHNEARAAYQRDWRARQKRAA